MLIAVVNPPNSNDHSNNQKHHSPPCDGLLPEDDFSQFLGIGLSNVFLNEIFHKKLGCAMALPIPEVQRVSGFKTPILAKTQLGELWQISSF